MDPEESKKMISPIEVEGEEEDRHSERAMQIVSASVLPMVLKTATQLGVLDIIARAGPTALLSPSQIASHLSSSSSSFHSKAATASMLDRILRLLAAHSILTCSNGVGAGGGDDDKSERLYGLAPVSKYFIPNHEGVSLSPMLCMMQDRVMINVWEELKNAVVEGGVPFNRAYGMSGPEYLGKDERFGKIFMASMSDYSTMLMNKVLDSYTSGFEGLKCIVDVAGGNGSVLKMIISRYPFIKGINFDLGHVIEKAPPYPGIQHVSGDMFEGSIPQGDAIFMKWILHMWDEEHCLKILKNCYEALPENGKVMVVDLVVPEAVAGDETITSVRLQSLLQFESMMMTTNPGGKERTLKEIEKIAREAGFSSIKVACSAYTVSLLEFYKGII